MAITQRQFNHLKEMGVNVWQQRNAQNTDEGTEAIASSSPEATTLIACDLKEISQQQLFTDILQCADISIGEVTATNNTINLGLFNWQFVEAKEITFANSTLTTPELETIKTSTTLKRGLWKIIQQEVLT